MIRDYICEESTIILCVVEASADILTADAIKLAKEYDKEGKRTFGILTKMDDFNSETSDSVKNAIKVVKNESYKLRLGYIGVSNK